ncbi:hypothetical protein [Bernardetia sp.]|uniref:hypothetical protein n=1 Tax=Bernardetia sp. TaxID=1937974 RepID=UPI0025BCEEB5|nr:hypothetical protein [Bernardetia sp.]
MSQTSRKISSFIGLILLAVIIAFTVFINFSGEETVKEAELIEEVPVTETQIEVEEPKYRVFDSVDVANLWSFNRLEIKKIYVNEARVYMTIKKDFSNTGLGILGFSYKKTTEASEKLLDNVEVISLNSIHSDSATLLKIGATFIEYQIKNITTPYKGLTIIKLSDDRDVILVKPNIEIRDNYYQNIVENAQYLNDSTRIVVPHKKLH